MLFKMLLTWAVAIVLAGCCCFFGSVDEERENTDIVGWGPHSEGAGDDI